MKTLSKEQVLRLHNALLETFGGTAGVRDDGLLESALNAPFATFGGQYIIAAMHGGISLILSRFQIFPYYWRKLACESKLFHSNPSKLSEHNRICSISTRK